MLRLNADKRDGEDRSAVTSKKLSKAILWAYFDKLEGENQSAMHKIRINISQTIEVL